MLKVSDEIRSSHNGDGALVLDIRHGQMFRLNIVGSRILELLENGHTEAQIVRQISEQFGVACETVAGNVREFLAHLEEHGLLLVEEAKVPKPAL